MKMLHKISALLTAAVMGAVMFTGCMSNGPTIAEEDLPYVFDRFYKSDKSRGLDKIGVGLGLYIVKTMLNACGESIRAESEEGEYCSFTFTIKKAN